MVQDSYFTVENENIPAMPIKNWIILLLASKDKRKIHDVHSIMMEVFMLVFEVLPSLKEKFEFKSTSYGPFSDKVGMIINQLLSTKMIKVKGNNKNVFGGRGYILTDAGAQKAEKLVHQLSPDVRQKMELLKTTTNHMGLTGMVQFIYSNHPEYVFLPDGGGQNV
jgi:uncharacterized protein YwgA